MSIFNLFKKKREIKLICFDLDNTLEKFRDAESETEVHIAEKLHKEIKYQ